MPWADGDAHWTDDGTADANAATGTINVDTGAVLAFVSPTGSFVVQPGQTIGVATAIVSAPFEVVGFQLDSAARISLRTSSG